MLAAGVLVKMVRHRDCTDLSGELKVCNANGDIGVLIERRGESHQIELTNDVV
jgi:hypothetical protein